MNPKMSKINENIQEDKDFALMIDSFLKKELVTDGAIRIGKTPYSLVIANANPNCDLYIAPGTILKCVSNHGERYHAHSINIEILKSILSELRNPILISKGSHENSLVAVTSLKDNNNQHIIISVDLNAKEKHFLVNKITSSYGKKQLSKYLDKQIKTKTLIAYNKNKANEMFQSLGLQLPPEESVICFDDSIAYTLDNVNYPF